MYISWSSFDLRVDGNSFNYSTDAEIYSGKEFNENVPATATFEITVYYDLPVEMAKNPNATIHYNGGLFAKDLDLPLY